MTPAPVRLLHDRVVDQIAAGEVVERPGSVVKELVENALDAGARAIDVAVRDGGKALIRVADDGHGMAREDAMLAIERHATSKIRTIEDLGGVRTLGFRGEALPSIAAVSRFELVTRPADAEVGTKIRLDAGTLTDVRDAAAAPGTVIEVRSLFHTLPARRAFLRSGSTELGHCSEAVLRAALVRTDVAFVLRHEDRELINAPAGASIGGRAAGLLGLDPHGFTAIDAADGGYALSGVAAAPALHRASIGTAMYLFVGGRWVRDPVLRRAVHTAYRDLVPDGRHPVVVLDLVVPDGAVDVNVHPSKVEVRFRDPAGVAAFVAERLRAAIRQDPRRSGQRAPPDPGALFAAVPTLPMPLRGLPTAVPAMPPEPVSSPSPERLAQRSPSPAVAAEPAPEPFHAVEPREIVVIGIVRGRWLVVAVDDRIEAVDGGALARRVDALAGDGGVHRLLIPARVPVGRAGLAAIEACAEPLAAIGLVAGVFSGSEAVVRSVPAWASELDPADVLRGALAGLVDGEHTTPHDLLVRLADALPPRLVSDPAGLVDRARTAGIAIAPVIGALSLPQPVRDIPVRDPDLT